MSAHKDVLVQAREKGRKLNLVALDLKNEPGALADVSNRLADNEINVVVSFNSSPNELNISRWSAIVEGARTAPDRLTRLLGQSKFVERCEVKESHNGLLVDSLNFPLRWNTGDRAIMLRTHFFNLMKEKLEETLKSGADVVLYELGYEHGRPSWQDFLVGYKIDSALDLQEALHTYGAVGWGRPTVESFDPQSKTAKIRVKDNFECQGQKSESPASHFFRGHLAGAFSVIFGQSVKVEESQCIAIGSEYCEFAVS